MLTAAPAILLSTALLLALLLNLTLKPAFYPKLTALFLVISALGGVIFYGAGYMELTGDLAQTVVRTILSVLRMFLGVNELSAIAGSHLVANPANLFVFWLLHLLAFVSVASAALNTLGAEAVRQLRFLLSRRGDLTLIYGINENCIALGKDFTIVFISVGLYLVGGNLHQIVDASANGLIFTNEQLGHRIEIVVDMFLDRVQHTSQGID